MRLRKGPLVCLAVAGLLAGAGWGSAAHAGADDPRWFTTSDRCVACHNGLFSSTGADVSIGFDWRASVMANASRDPYWQAAVRRESIDFPNLRAHIEDECSRCHAPMATTEANAAGRPGTVMDHFEAPTAQSRADQLARDGVSCALCHQITSKNLGRAASFVGRFVVDEHTPWGQRAVFGPFSVDTAHASIMQSSARLRPTHADHVRDSALCATCHTLYTDSRGPKGEVVVEFPEQVPYLEWLHSDYPKTQSCQSCHMNEVADGTPYTSVLPVARKGWRQHEFLGGNFVLQELMAKYATELRSDVPSRELSVAAGKTRAFLAERAARLSVRARWSEDGRVEAEVRVDNLSGHKLPTAYPSRRAWIHFTVADRTGKLLFESGALEPTGAITGNDNDRDPNRFEPHYTRIDAPEQVQVYESIMGSAQGRPTTGLLSGVRYLKDNRLLPRGFDKVTAPADAAVHGEAAADPDFAGGGDLVTYVAMAGRARGPLRVQAELWYEPVGYRWAHNLDGYAAAQPQRFTAYYRDNARSVAAVLARAEMVVSLP